MFRDREAWLSPLTDTDKLYRLRYTDEPTTRARRGTAGAYPTIRMMGKKSIKMFVAEGELVYP